jgi:hypothetical protein
MSKKVVIGLAAVGLMLALAGSAGAQLGQGNILIEEWYTANTGQQVTDNVDTLHAYIDSGKAPSKSYWAKKMDRPDGGEDYWGGRMRGYIIPPETGDYTFWTASDDDSEVWLSTDDNPANAKMVCNVEGWMNYQDWTYTSGSPGTTYKSAPIPLQAGKRYYVDVFFSDGTGGGFDTVAWGGPGIGAGPVVVDGQYLAAFIRSPEPLFKATNPDPANGAKEVTSPLFQWTAGATAVMHEVYMGTNPTPGPAEFMGPWPTAMYFHIPGLTPGATYYWRVDEVDASGGKITGDVWSFSTQSLQAHDPSPADGALWRPTNTTVKWTAGQGAVSHKLYGSDDKAAVTAGADSALLATVAEAQLDASTLLQPGKTYYWRVDEVDSTGKVTPGPVWSFSTVDPAGGAIAEYFNNNSLSGIPAVVKVVPDINFSWPSGSVKGTNSPDPAIQVDNFSARFTAQLNVPVSGKYKLYGASDDGERLFLNGVRITNGWANRGETEDASADQDLVAGKQYIIVMEYYEATGGAAARLRWSGPGIAKEIIPQGALQIPQIAISPNPGDNAVDVPDTAVLSFTPGPKAVVHTMYFGTDKAKVTAGDPSVALPPTDQIMYVPAKLDWNTTYYWKVDEMAADGTTFPGLVWSFTTANFVVIEPGQKTLNYNNTVDPFISQLELGVPADLTKNGVTDLVLRFQGQAAAQGSFSYDAATGTYSVGGAGSDIWGTADQFTYAFKALEGNGSMIARVVSDDGKGANTWSKAGVMIRETLAAGSTHAFMPITAGGGNGRSFQRRLATNGSSTNADGPAPTIAAPYWVKIERMGDDFSGYVSETGDPNSWVQVGAPVTIVMKDPVFIGLAVTAHVAGTVRTWTFDSVSTTGKVVPAGPVSSWEIINTVQNDPAPLYVALEDKAGQMAMVTNPNPAAVNTTVMDLWRVPMSAFAGVNLQNAAKLYVGVGDGKPDGSGTMTFADIRVVKVVNPDPAAIDVTMKGDPLVGLPNDGVNTGGSTSGWPAAEVPTNVIDNDVTTKFLHFKGEVEPTGFAVTPSMGATVVTGLTFTTANDAAERDPVAWELYGSNASIDGPWMLIAKGAIDDFARPIDWPRRWKSVTPIGFANKLAFLNYRVMFTAVKRPAAANSMQIAEVELLGTPAAAPSPTIMWVSFHSAANDAPSTAAAGVGFTAAADKGYTDLLKANGYAVVRYLQTNNPDVATLNAANLVILSRSVASSSFQNAAADLWNGVTAPMIITNGYLSRKSRLGFNAGSGGPQDITGDIKLTVKDPAHPIFAGIALTGDTMTSVYAGLATYPTDGTKAAGISIVTDPANADGKTLATLSAASGSAPAGAMVIAEWQAGGKAIHDGGAGTDVLGGHRLVFLTGSRENGGKTSETAGMYDLTPDGEQMFLNAVAYMLQ